MTKLSFIHNPFSLPLNHQLDFHAELRDPFILDKSFFIRTLNCNQNILFYSSYFSLEPMQVIQAFNLRYRFKEIINKKALNIENNLLNEFRLLLYLSLNPRLPILVDFPFMLFMKQEIIDLLKNSTFQEIYFISSKKPPNQFMCDNYQILYEDYSLESFSSSKEIRMRVQNLSASPTGEVN